MDLTTFGIAWLVTMYSVTWASRENLRREVKALREELGK